MAVLILCSFSQDMELIDMNLPLLAINYVSGEMKNFFSKYKLTQPSRMLVSPQNHHPRNIRRVSWDHYPLCSCCYFLPAKVLSSYFKTGPIA